MSLDETFINELQTWCSEHKVIENGQRNFWNAFARYEVEEPEEFFEVIGNENRDCIQLILDKIKLCQNDQMDYGKQTIEVDFDITLKEQRIGWYREVYFLDGEFVDDYFVIE